MSRSKDVTIASSSITNASVALSTRAKTILLVAFVLLSVFGAVVYWWFFGLYRFAGYFGVAKAPSQWVGLPRKDDALLWADICSNSLKLHSLEVADPTTGGLITPNNCRLITRSPWVVDRNHSWPFGHGVLNVLMFSRARGYVRRHGLGVFGYDDTTVPLSLVGRKLYVRYQVKGLADGSSLHFWIQGGDDETRYANYVHRSSLPVDSDGVHGYVIDIGDASQFNCLGATFRKAKMYGCNQSAAEVLRDINVDFGFIRMVRSGPEQGRTGAEFAVLQMTIR